MNEMTLPDLGEMLGLLYMFQDAGAAKVQLDTPHAVEILQRLIAHEMKAEQ